MIKGDVIGDILDGYYFINKSGEVFSRHYEEKYCCYKIKERIDKDGYPIVNLRIDGERKTLSIHRLLALTFIPNPANKTQVNHKNGNKLDYSLINLEWSTPSENMQHAMDNGLCKPPNQPRSVVDVSTGKIYPSLKKAAVDLNISYSKCKKHLTGMVKYKTSLKYVS